jgi:hypothetical protein
LPGPLHQTEAHVLAKAAHAGDHTVLTCFSPADGLLTVLLRAPRGQKPDAAPAPDLFDRLALALEHGRGSPSGGPWFVREHRLLARHAGIGRDYAPLACASRLARLVAQNPGPEDSRAVIDALLTQAFTAFARPAARPELVYFKSLYLLARDEGLPLKQEWVPALPPGDRDAVGALLRLPADSPEAPPAADATRLAKRLETYLVAHHDFRIG